MADTAAHRDRNARLTSYVQTAALVVGVVFLLVGIAGFIPGITSDYDLMEFAGHESEAELLGLFQVSILHNVVHVAFGIAGVVASRHWNSARGYLIGGGVVYLLLWVYGLVTDLDSDANFVPLNTADNWLHFVLGSGMIALGLLLPRAGQSGVQRGSSSHPPLTTSANLHSPERVGHSPHTTINWRTHEQAVGAGCTHEAGFETPVPIPALCQD